MSEGERTSGLCERSSRAAAWQCGYILTMAKSLPLTGTLAAASRVSKRTNGRRASVMRAINRAVRGWGCEVVP